MLVIQSVDTGLQIFSSLMILLELLVKLLNYKIEKLQKRYIDLTTEIFDEINAEVTAYLQICQAVR